MSNNEMLMELDLIARLISRICYAHMCRILPWMAEMECFYILVCFLFFCALVQIKVIVTSPMLGMRSIAMSVSMCLYVCVSARINK